MIINHSTRNSAVGKRNSSAKHTHTETKKWHIVTGRENKLISTGGVAPFSRYLDCHYVIILPDGLSSARRVLSSRRRGRYHQRRGKESTGEINGTR